MNTTENKKYEIYKKALLLAVPMMIQNGITNAVGLVDNLMVGSLGTESMTAVSIAGQLVFVFNLAIFGGLSGPGIYGAQYFGYGQMEGVRNVFRLKWWIGVICVIAGVLAFIFAGDQLLSLYLHGESEEIDAVLTLNYAKQYLNIMLWGFLPFTITQIYAGSLRETGESVKPMVAGICSVFTDVLLNYLLIYGNWGFPEMGVRGAAVATVIARYVELTVLVIWAHHKKKEHIFLDGVYSTMLLTGGMAKPIIKKGLPIFLNEFLWAAGIASLTQCYSLLGLSVVAGMNISNAICNLLNVVFIAMGNAVGIIIGQQLGASKYEEAQKNGIKLMWFCGFMCLVLTGILFALSKVFPTFYDTTQEVRDYGTMFIRINAAFFPVQGFLNALYFTLRSGGKTVVTFLFDSVYSWVICVPIAFCLCSFSSLAIAIIFIIVQSLDLIKVIIGYILIKKGVWVTNLVAEENA